MSHEGRHSFPAIVIAVLLILMSPSQTAACGWWGDGEASDSDDAIEVDALGRPVVESLILKSMKLPGRMGYGIAVPEPGRAIPYLLATSGRPVKRIDKLKDLGFRSVIDLGTPEATARLHRSETEAVGMQYFNIPVEGDIPNEKQTDSFNRVVVNAHNGPLLVYAPRAALLGMMWASYHLSLGAPLEFALREGRSLGLSAEQEMELRNRLPR